MLTQVSECRRLVLVRLDPGEDIVQAVRTAAEEHGLRHGLILSGVGSVDRYHVHVVETPGGAIHDVFTQEEAPYDILALSGMVIEGRVHAHITLAGRQQAIGGHLEEGTRILTFGMAVLAEVPGADIADWDRVGPIERPPQA